MKIVRVGRALIMPEFIQRVTDRRLLCMSSAIGSCNIGMSCERLLCEQEEDWSVLASPQNTQSALKR